MRLFFDDFGFDLVKESMDGNTLYFGGSGIDPYSYVAVKTDEPQYLGGVYCVASHGDLETALRIIPDAKGPFQLEGPGGGEMVSCADPDGLPFHLVYGTEEREGREPGKPLAKNEPISKPRKGEFLRFTHSPARVHKLGHFGTLVSNFRRTYDFFTTHFNLVASDILTIDEGKTPVAAFCHIDLGKTYVDHHTFFFSENSKRTGVHHCSFEVQDVDTQMLGHRWLEKKGYQSVWGVGRHILGSQIFDYWYEPEGKFMIEHYADGDLVNDEHVQGLLPASDEALAVWGPAVPDGFLD